MSIAAASVSHAPLSGQKQLTARSTIPARRILIAKPDSKLTPEPR